MTICASNPGPNMTGNDAAEQDLARAAADAAGMTGNAASVFRFGFRDGLAGRALSLLWECDQTDAYRAGVAAGKAAR